MIFRPPVIQIVYYLQRPVVQMLCWIYYKDEFLQLATMYGYCLFAYTLSICRFWKRLGMTPIYLGQKQVCFYFIFLFYSVIYY